MARAGPFSRSRLTKLRQPGPRLKLTEAEACLENSPLGVSCFGAFRRHAVARASLEKGARTVVTNGQESEGDVIVQVTFRQRPWTRARYRGGRGCLPSRHF